MKTIRHISFKSLVLVALATLFTLPAKAQMTDNGYANIDWQYNFPINNAFTDRSSGWGMNFDGGYFLTENWAIGAFLSYHTNHEYVPRRTITSGSASLTTDQQHTAAPASPPTSSTAPSNCPSAWRRATPGTGDGPSNPMPA